MSWPHHTNNLYSSQSTARSLRQIKFQAEVSGQVVLVVAVGSLLISGLEGDGNQCNCTAVYRPLLYITALYTPDHCHHTLTLLALQAENNNQQAHSTPQLTNNIN